MEGLEPSVAEPSITSIDDESFKYSLDAYPPTLVGASTNSTNDVLAAPAFPIFFNPLPVMEDSSSSRRSIDSVYSVNSGYGSLRGSPSVFTTLPSLVTSRPMCPGDRYDRILLHTFKPMPNKSPRVSLSNSTSNVRLKDLDDRSSYSFGGASCPSAGSYATPEKPYETGNFTSSSDNSNSDDTSEDDMEELDSDTESMIFAEVECRSRCCAKQKMLRNIMHEFYAMYGQHLSGGLRSHTGSPPSAQSPIQNSGKASSNKAVWSSRKRHFDDDDPPSPRDDRRKRQKPEPSSPGDYGENGLFACPFHKFDPRKYCCSNSDSRKYRACAGPGFESIARLKQHLKRTHKSPIYCLRCWLVFEEEQELLHHQRNYNQCDILPLRFMEGITQDKMKMINKRNVTWKDIYEILFPGAPVPSPYYEPILVSSNLNESQSPVSQSLAEYESYSRSELPRLVQTELESRATSGLVSLEETLKASLVDVVRTCQSALAQRPFNGIDTSLTLETPTGSLIPTANNVIANSEVSTFYRGPPPLTEDASATAAHTFHQAQRQGQLLQSAETSDSGYTSPNQEPKQNVQSSRPSSQFPNPRSVYPEDCNDATSAEDKEYFATNSFQDPNMQQGYQCSYPISYSGAGDPVFSTGPDLGYNSSFFPSINGGGPVNFSSVANNSYSGLPGDP
ncbi:MAG: hypothetical protein M1834_003777 [Cirrosporium novae-zelandiae]|nr:MAG: hypothetical protein M1834_003777 [Cirrosporium novae-zelandiae]